MNALPPLHRPLPAQIAARNPGDRLVILTENSATRVVPMLAAQALHAWPAVLNAGPTGKILKRELAARADVTARLGEATA